MAVASDVLEEALDDAVFAPEGYALDVPETDGLQASEITIRFLGVLKLDKTNAEHLSLVSALKPFSPVRFVCIGEAAGKGFRFERNDEGEVVSAYVSLRISELELGEAV